MTKEVSPTPDKSDATETNDESDQKIEEEEEEEDEKADVKDEERSAKSTDAEEPTLEIRRVRLICRDGMGKEMDVTLEGDQIPEGQSHWFLSW